MDMPVSGLSNQDLSTRDISVIIVNYNTSSLLKQCVQAAQDNLQGLSYEIIVVDNASSDGSAGMIREEFPEVSLIENNENLGFACANNRGIQVSKGRYILLLNSDAFLKGLAPAKMVTFLDQNPEAGIAGANLFFPDGQPQLCYGPLPTLRSDITSLLGLDKLTFRMAQVKPLTHSIETGVVSGACMMARREMLDEIGLLDEDYYMYSEEVDLCYRAHQAGWKVVHLPQAQAIHVGGGSSGPTARRMLMLYQGKLKYYAKHYGPLREKSLLAAMRITISIKLLAYGLLRLLIPRREPKHKFWRDVAHGLGELRA